jgi:dipeptidyl aminopeptidase/acylaminoacyl peptidase
MKKLTYLLSSILGVVVLVSCQPSATDNEQVRPSAYTIEQFLKTESIGGSSFSPDESKILFSSDKSGIFNTYEINIADGSMKPLTNSKDEFAFAISYFPEDERFLFTSDQGGNEINHIYLHDLDGLITDITPDSTAKASFWGWSYDNKSFFHLSNKRNPQFFDLIEVDISSSDEGSESGLFVSSTIYENNEGFDVSEISRDKRYLILVKTHTTNNNDMYLFDRETNKTQLLSEHTGEVNFNPQYFTPDGTYLVYTTDQDNEFSYLRKYNLQTGDTEIVEQADWDIMYSYISRNGRYRVVAINEDAKTTMKVYDEIQGTQVDLPEFPSGDITSVNISDSEQLMTFYVNSSTSPSNLYLYNFENGEYKKLTNTLSPDIDPTHLVEGQVVRFTSFDGLEIPALLYKPKGMKPGEKAPATLWIHGGPGGQSRLNYSAVKQYLANHGYVVLAVNNRGSSGYGKTFYKSDDLKHGDVDLRDCVESKKLLAELGYVDMNRVAITGGSYGGYMVMAALTFTPEEFAAGVDIFGVTNWLRTLRSIPPWWGSFREALFAELGNPEADTAALYNKSPLFFAGNITKPFLVLQGANDPRVLKVESDEIVENARANGVTVEYIVFDDEGHGFTKKKNRIVAWESIVKFLDEYMPEEGTE